MKATIATICLSGAALAESGCSIHANVLDPRPFHGGYIFDGCTAQTDENHVVPNGTTCQKVSCKQFKFSSVENVICNNGKWSALPTCFKGCPAPTSEAGFQFVGCRKNLGQTTSKNKGWYLDTDNKAFYPPSQRCRKVQCPSHKAKETQNTFQVVSPKESRFECNCDSVNGCAWLGFNDEDHGNSLNDGVELSCASWTDWKGEGCTKKKRTETRECVQPNGDKGTAGIDCEGESLRQVSCGRKKLNLG
jgi:hypothetical protein